MRSLLRGEVLRHAIVVVLFVTWGTMTGLKVKLFLSEPTATRTIWERSPFIPDFSVCSNSRYDAAQDWPQDWSLKRLYREMGPQPEQLVYGLERQDEGDVLLQTEPSNHNVTFRASIDYVFGGLCATARVPPGLKFFEVGLIPADTVSFYFHGRSTFWGSYLFNEHYQQVLAADSGVLMKTTVSREVRPNLRRRPCEPDPEYDQRACLFSCFLDRLSCSMADSAPAGRPACTAADDEWYYWEWGAYRTFMTVAFPGPDGAPGCPRCPEPCVLEYYAVSVAPHSQIPANATFRDVYLLDDKLMQTLETYVTYSESDLLADIGGYLGLFLGYSLLTFFESLPAILARLGGKLRGRETRQTPPTAEGRPSKVVIWTTASQQ